MLDEYNTRGRRSPRRTIARCSSDKEHVDRYRETDGEEGHDWQGTQTLLLTTTGRAAASHARPR